MIWAMLRELEGALVIGCLIIAGAGAVTIFAGCLLLGFMHRHGPQ